MYIYYEQIFSWKYKMKKISILTAIMLILLIIPSKANNASHVAIAEELLEVTQAQKMIDEVFNYINQYIDQSLEVAKSDFPPEALQDLKQLQTEMKAWFAEFFGWDTLKPIYIEVYTSVFDEDELTEMVAFYKTPLGQKMLAKMPELMQKSMTITQESLADKLPELEQKLAKKLEEISNKYER